MRGRLQPFFRRRMIEKLFSGRWRVETVGKSIFLNTAVDKYPCRFIAGPDYFVFVRDLGCRFIRVADIDDTYAEEEKSRLRYSMGNYRVMQNVTMGISLIIEYKSDSVSYKDDGRDKLYLENGKQLAQVIELIRKHCPDSERFMADL